MAPTPTVDTNGPVARRQAMRDVDARVVVVIEQGQVAGILTDRDITSAPSPSSATRPVIS
jgi:CBS domain-containing protein